MIYILGWITIYLAFTFHKADRYSGRVLALCSILILSMIAFFRGDVGTDTFAYEKMLLEFLSDYSWDGREPGFVLTGWLLAQITPSVEIAVRTISLAFFTLIALYVCKSDRNELNFLLLYVLPVFAYSYSMNALRAALAFGCILLAVQALRRKQKLIAGGLSMTGVLFHYSLFIPLAYLGLSQRPWFSRNNILWSVSLIILISSVFFMHQEYFLNKFMAYSNFPSPSRWSGLSIVLPLAILLCSLSLGRLPSSVKRKLFYLAFASLIFSWLLSQYSYAGLRVLDLLAYAIPISILMAYSRHNLQFDRFMVVGLFVAGLISVIASYYRFVSTYGVGRAPWLPYESWLNTM